MAVTFVNAQSNQNATGSTSIAVTKPTGLANNDVLIASVVAKGTTNSASLPTGFTQILSTTGSSGDQIARIGYKVVTNAAGEGASYSFAINPSAKAAASVSAYRGLNTSSPISAQWIADVGATGSPYFTQLEHPYRPHPMAFFILGGGTGTTTFTSSDTAANPIVERIDTTNSGGGSGTSKVSLAIADALVNPKEYIDPVDGDANDGKIYAYGGWYSATTTWTNGTISAMLVFNDAAATAIGTATTLDTSATLIETLVAPLQFTFDKQVAYTRHQMTMWGAPRHTPIAGINTLDTVYEVSNGRFVSLYAEFDERWANNATYGREQEGKAISFLSYNNYTTFGEPDADFVWGTQSAEDGSGGIDSIRFSDNVFVTYSGNGHTYGSSPGGGTYNYFLNYGPRSKFIRYNPATNTFTNLGTVVPFSSYDKLNNLGAVIKSGPTTVTYSGAKRRDDATLGTVSEYGAKVVHIDPVTDVITQGTTVYFHPENSGTHYYQTQVSHVDDAKVLFFYYNNTTNAYVARVGHITNDVNGKPVVLAFSATINNTPNTSTSVTTFPAMKPIALSATEGFYLHQPSTNTRTLVLQRYTVNADDTVTFGSQILIKDSSATGAIEGYSVAKVGGQYVVATSYRTNTANNTSAIDVNYISWNSGTNSLTSTGSETVLTNSTSPYKGLHVTKGFASNRYHIKYVFNSDTTRPFFSSFTTPANQINSAPQSAFIQVGTPVPLTGSMGAFIPGEGIGPPAQGAFIEGTPADLSSDTDAFTHGWQPILSSTLAFVNYTENVQGFQTCFLQSEPAESDTDAYTHGWDILTSSTLVYITYPERLSDTQSCYIHGLESRTSGVQRLFFTGHRISTHTLPLSAYISSINGIDQGNNPLGAFINGEACIAPAQFAFITTPEIFEHEEPLVAYVVGTFIAKSEPLLSYVPGWDKIVSEQFCLVSGALPQSAQDITGGAIKFDKTKLQYGTYYDDVDVRPTTELTVNFWMKAYDVAISSRPGFFLKQYGSSRSFGIYEGAVGTRKWHYGVDTDTTGWGAIDTVGDWVADKWYMCTLRYSYYTEKCAFFVNGVKDSEFTKTGFIRWNGDSAFIAYRPDNGAYANMAFADYDLWNYALTDQEIADLYHPPVAHEFVGGFISGTITESITDNSLGLSVVSTFAQNNPGKENSSVMCAIAFDAKEATQKAYIVGGTVTPGLGHDLKIIIDNFGETRHDLAIRVGGQGERVNRTQLGAVDYPVTRDSFRDLPNLFYQDMPGKLSELQRCFINSGFQWNSTDGNVSGVENGPPAAIRRAYIVVKSPVWYYQMAYLHGAFNTISDQQTCYISNSNHTVTQGAYVASNELLEFYASQEAFINVAAPPDIETDIGLYISGQDDMEVGPQWGHITTAQIASGFTNVYISTTSTTEIQTIEGQAAYMFGSALAFDDGQKCFIPASFQIDTFLTLEENGLDFFLHAQPTAEVSVGCFINCPWPWMHIEPMLGFIYGNQPETIVQPLFIQSSRNEEGSSAVFVTSHMPMESARRGYIEGILETATPSLSSRQTAFINSETPTSDSTACYISSAAYSIDSIDTSGYQAFIVSDIVNTNPLKIETSIGVFISSVQSSPSGELIAGFISAFISNTEVRSMKISTACFISSSDLGHSATSSTSAVIVNTQIRTIGNSMGCSIVGEIIHPGGESITGAKAAFITNEENEGPPSVESSIGLFIASASNEGALLETKTLSFIMNQNNLANKSTSKRCFIKVGPDTTILVGQTCYIFGSYTVTDANTNIVGGFIEGHV